MRNARSLSKVISKWVKQTVYLNLIPLGLIVLEKLAQTALGQQVVGRIKVDVKVFVRAGICRLNRVLAAVGIKCVRVKPGAAQREVLFSEQRELYATAPARWDYVTAKHVTVDVPYGSSVAIVGDVHGCLEELQELCALLPDTTVIVLVGDLVHKGRFSAEVVQYVRQHPVSRCRRRGS